MWDIKALSLLQKRVIFTFGLAGVAAIVIALTNPFAGGTEVMTEEGSMVMLGTADNTNEGEVGTDVGDAAPNFMLTDSAGNVVSLDQFLGEKAVVVNFWASWCNFCLEEMPDLESVAQEFSDDLVILGINNQETVAQGEPFALARGVTYPLLYLPRDDQIVKAYQVLAMPTTYYIDIDGIIVDRSSASTPTKASGTEPSLPSKTSASARHSRPRSRIHPPGWGRSP